MSAGKALEDAVVALRPKASNGRPKMFLGAQDAAVILRVLRAAVSDASPRGLACSGKIVRASATLWTCKVQDLVTGKPRGTRWILRTEEKWAVLKSDPREAA